MRKNPSRLRGYNKDYCYNAHGRDTGRFQAERIELVFAHEFIDEMNSYLAFENSSYRLPTEAEWKYAYRAGTESKFRFGRTLNGTQTNYRGNRPNNTLTKGPFLDRTSEIGNYPSYSLRLFDIYGHVCEWCLDWYDENYYAKSTDMDRRRKVGESRVI